MIAFSTALRQAPQSLAQEIGEEYDAEGYDPDLDLIAEAVADAGRLAMRGKKAEQSELDGLFLQHGYEVVLG